MLGAILLESEPYDRRVPHRLSEPSYQEYRLSRAKTSGDEPGGFLFADARWDGEPPARGYLYLGELYIEEVQPHWPDAAKARGKWHLLLDRDDWITDDLETLERKLYDWAVSEGYFEDKDSIDAA
jgi:hypothetical protein